MIVHVPFLLLGLALLWYPRSWMRLGVALWRRRRRHTDRSLIEPWKVRASGDPRISFRDEFLKVRNYVDLARALVGGLTLSGGMGLTAALELPAQPSHGVVLQVLGWHIAILFIGVVIQTTRYENRRITFYPPIFYLAGLSVSLGDPAGALFAFVLIWAVNAAIGNAQAFLSVYALFVGVFGYLFGAGFMAIYGAVLCLVPVLLSLLSNRPLVVFARKTSRAAAPSP